MTQGANAYGAALARDAAATIRDTIGDHEPEIGIVLGSGLGGLAEQIENQLRVPFALVPGLPDATVPGHAGALVAGALEGRRVLAFAGRFHMYEGHSAAHAAFPMRILHALGARTVFLSNAAGAVRQDLKAGDLMLIEDHLNLTATNPLTGPVDEGDERFPDLTKAYDAGLRAELKRVAAEQAIELKSGVYAWLPGPSFETPAEVRMLRLLGADAVGMSTVPEVIVAAALRMRAIAVSCVTNSAADTGAPVQHTEVLEVAAGAAERFQALVRAFVRELPA